MREKRNNLPKNNLPKTRVLLVSLAVALVLAAIAAALSVVPGPALDLHAPRPTGASVTTGLMIVASPLLTLWGVSMYVRCSDAVVRRYLVAMAALLIAWLLIVLVKYALVSDIAAQICWYLFYVPLIFIPTICLFASLRSASFGCGRKETALRGVVAAISCALVVFVLTNNAHMLVFVFDPANPSWSSDYAYGIGYWVVTGWECLLFAVFFALLFRVAHQQLRTAFLPVLLLCLLAVIYGALYIMRVDVVFRGNFSLTYIVVLAIALELCLDLGLLPSFLRYREAFSKLPFDAKILSLNGEQVFATACASSLKDIEAKALAQVDVPYHGMVSFKVESEPDKAYKVYRLHGGLALLTEDRESINGHIRLLAEHRKLLSGRNAVLQQDIALKSRLYRQERERMLMEDVNTSLQSAVAAIRQLLDNVPDAANEQSAAERRRHLMLVKLLLAYCKRKGGFVLSEKGDADFNRERLQLVVSETVADVRSAGIDCGALVETAGLLPVSSLSILYDCFYDVVVMAFECTNPVLMFFITERDDKRVELRIMLECDDKLDFGTSAAAQSLRAALDARDVAYRLVGDVDELRLVAVVSKKQALPEGGAL